MKYLFIVQGEGRGHLTQAIALEEILRNSGHEVVEVLVGKSSSRQLPAFFNRNIHAPIRRFESPNFLPTASNKRNNLTRSIAYNVARLPVYLQSIRFIKEHIARSGADMVINFYELLTGLAYALYRIDTPQVCIGHQYLFLHRDFRFPEKHTSGLMLLQFFTRLTCMGACKKLALSFRSMDEDTQENIRVVPPLLRKEVLQCENTTQGDYIHGYMVNSGFAENVRQWHSAHPETALRFFWDRKGEKNIRREDDTLSFYPLNDTEFLRQMSGCRAYASTAGFESICEAMFLGKPALMVPAHIEQDCNAFDAASNGAGIVADNFELDRLLDFAEHYTPDPRFRTWVESAPYIIRHALDPDIYGQQAADHMYMVEEFT